MDETATFSITGLRDAFRDGVLTPVEAVEICLERIDRLDGSWNTFISVWAEPARRAAKEARDRWKVDGESAPLLLGIPIAVKDLIDVVDSPTTSASNVHRGRVASHDAFVIKKLRDAGAILLGKTNLHEFAFGVTNLVSCFGPTRNPWDRERMTGGSSGGSAAAVAAGFCPGALGTDTGGSIRIPASLCGTVGLKPTFGRVSCRGVWPLSWSLDHVGPLTRTVADAGWLLQAMSGFDAEDPASHDWPGLDVEAALSASPVGIRVGFDPHWSLDQTEPAVAAAFESALIDLGKLGVCVRRLEIPELERVHGDCLTLLRGDSLAVHRDLLDQHGDLYQSETRQRLREGCDLSAIDYALALRFQRAYGREARRLFDAVDVIASPTTPCTAPALDAHEIDVGQGLTPVRPLLTRFMRLYNFLGWPALSLPIGCDGAGLPIGLQLSAAPGEEGTLIRLGQALEQHLDGPMTVAEG